MSQFRLLHLHRRPPRAAGTALLAATMLLGACGGGATAPEAAPDEAPQTPHRLFSRPTSEVALGDPGEGAAVVALLETDSVWLAGWTIPRPRFFARHAEKGERFAGRILRASLEIVPAGHGVSSTLGRMAQGERAERTFDVNDSERSLESLEVGEVLIDARGVHVVLPPGENLPEELTISYRVESDELLADLLSPPPSVGEPVTAGDLLVKKDSRRSLQLAFPTRLGWTLQAGDSGASLRFAFGLKDERAEMDRDEVRLEEGAARGARFTVSFIDRDGAERELWAREVGAREAGRRLDASIEALPADAEGGRLVLAVDHLDPADEGKQLLTYWSEPILRAAATDDQVSDAPNVLLILLDTLRADRLGCYGYERPTSPVLDRVAAEGVRFSDSWSAAPWTLPSHASLFSSLYMSEHGVWDRRFRLSEDAVTLAEVLGREGYETGAFTASGFVRPEYGFAQGFDRFWYSGGDFERIFTEAFGWIKGSKGPYFAFVHTYHVHSPHDPEGAAREQLVRPYEGELPTVVHTPDYPWGQRRGEAPAEADVRYVSDLYDAEIREVDHAVGRLLAGLKASGNLENTLVIITSDHGEEFAEHAHFEHGWSLYEEQLAVPLIMHLPGRFEGGVVVDYPVIGIDIAPTIASVVGAPVPEDWSGAVLGVEPPETDRPIWVPYRTRNSGLDAVALRRGSMKYMEFPGGIRPLDPWSEPRVYDLGADPGERADLWSNEPKRDRARWGRAAEALKAAYPLRHESSSVGSDEQMAAQLKALGYGGG